jgi:hypothetical protein
MGCGASAVGDVSLTGVINYHSFGHEAHCASPYERSRSERFALCAKPMPEDFEPQHFEKSEEDTLLIVTGLQGKNLFARLGINVLTKLAQVIRRGWRGHAHIHERRAASIVISREVELFWDMESSRLGQVMREVTVHMHEPIIEEGTVSGLKGRCSWGFAAGEAPTHPPPQPQCRLRPPLFQTMTWTTERAG